MRLAVLDWGIGGLGFLQLFAARRPDASAVYFSDAGFTPYGKVSRRTLAARLDHVLRHLRDARGVDHAVLACNAASTVLPDLAAPREGIAVAGVIAPAVDALAGMRPARVGVIGGQRTVRSGAYGRGLRAAGHHVRQRVAQPLSAHVEAGRLEGDAVRGDVARVLNPLRDVEILVLACTHYPALAPLLSERCPAAALFDPAAATLDRMEAEWPVAAAAPGPHRVLTTGDPETMRRSARLAFGMELASIESAAFWTRGEPSGHRVNSGSKAGLTRGARRTAEMAAVERE